MKKISPLHLFEAENSLSQNQIDFLNQCTLDIGSSWKYDSLRDQVKVNGNFDCSFLDLEDFMGIKFSEVTGEFDCSENDLETLKGCPKIVGKSFNCQDNNLKTLDFGPQSVGLNYECQGNELESLNGAPERIFGKFDCSFNRLKSMKDSPREIFKSLSCDHNQLESFEGLALEINKNLNCSHNEISSFKGIPKIIKGNLDLDNNFISDFKDYDLILTGNLLLQNNPLQSLVGLITPLKGTILLDTQKLDPSLANELKFILQDMKQSGLSFENSILYKGASITQTTPGQTTIPPGTFEKLSLQQRISNVLKLANIIKDPKNTNSIIQKNPEGMAITALIKNNIPDFWDKIKDLGGSKLSAELGDLYF